MKKSKTAGKLFTGLLLSGIVIFPVLRAEDVTRRVTEEEAKKSVTSKVTPEYPPMARQMKLGGKVQVDAYIDPEGNVEKVQVVTGNPLLTSAAVNAVKRWKFSPFTADGKATHAVAGFTFNFTP
jgi:TonB family protein